MSDSVYRVSEDPTQYKLIYSDPIVQPDPDLSAATIRALDNAVFTATQAFYDLMYDSFYDEILSWRWDNIVSEARENPTEDPYSDSDPYGTCYLGSVLTLYPSGKFYMPWTSNVTESEALIDELFSEALNAAARLHNGWIESGEGDPLDQYFGIQIYPDDSGE